MNEHVFTRDLTVPGTFNVRDLGGYATGIGTTRWRRILRSGGLDRLQDEGIAALREIGVTRVIDLRFADEHASHPNPLRDLPGIRFHMVSLFDGLAPDMMKPGDLLLDLYIEALDKRGPAFVEVMEIIAEEGEGALLFHCTAGKDRTGLIAAFLLALAGTDIATIAADYGLTSSRIAPLVERFRAEAAEKGIDPTVHTRILASEPATMIATLKHLETAHGGVEAYLTTHGLTPETLARLRARLSEDL
jgi:protein-tyrosine phosphatase